MPSFCALPSPYFKVRVAVVGTVNDVICNPQKKGLHYFLKKSWSLRKRLTGNKRGHQKPACGEVKAQAQVGTQAEGPERRRLAAAGGVRAPLRATLRERYVALVRLQPCR